VLPKCEASIQKGVMAWVYRLELASKQLVRLCLALACASNYAAAQIVQHGTYFVAAYTPDYAVVAIDSRQLSGADINDRYCKIRILSKSAFFFARGATSAVENNVSIFDARDVARSVFLQFGNGTTLAEIAKVWAARVKHIYQARPDEFGRSAIGGIMTDGFFVGIGANGDVVIEGQRIDYRALDAPKFINAAEPKPNRLEDPPNLPIYAAGYFELMNEFRNGGKTERARRIIAQFGASQGGPDAVAARYSAYVTAVRDWANDRAIGGETATIILEKGSGVRWFHRPDFCPEN
jgi:hypothetical protein